MTHSTTNPQSDEIIDVAIIGGGVSGAYTAYRLMTSEKWKNSDVRLFEMSDRIGGRLWSIHLEGLPNLPAEMGGMTFSRLQCNVYGLCTQELGLKTNRSNLYANDGLQYFREKHYWVSNYKNAPGLVPFCLDTNEKKMYPGSLVGKILNLILEFNLYIEGVSQNLARLPTDNPEHYIEQLLPEVNHVIDFLREARLNETQLYELGVDNVMVDVLSPGAYQLVKAVADLHSIRGNWNLYDHSLLSMRSMLFRDTFHTLEMGYDTLPKTLAREFEGQGGVVKMKSQLLNLQPDDGKTLIKLTHQENENKVEYYARNVVLALPQYALKQLPGCKTLFGHKFNLLDEVTASPAYKLILVYDEPWWEKMKDPQGCPVKTGFSLTDLQLQGCYYVGWNESTKRSLVIASLGDTNDNERFWSALRGKIEPSGQIDLNSGLVQEAQKQLKELHNIHSQKDFQIPAPVAARFWDWTDPPFGGGWHLWNPGVKSWEVAPNIRQPNPELNVFVCGEAYSEQQGWVEGAINSAEMVLEEHFGLNRPSWVKSEHYKFDT